MAVTLRILALLKPGVHTFVAVASLLAASGMEGQSYSLIHSFSGDFGTPRCSLLQAPDGSLYGTAEFGGSFRMGSVFVLTPKTSGGFEFATLYSFRGGDGANPRSALARGPDGYLYGTTANGGAYDGGTVFRIDAAGNQATLHSFPYSYRPSAALTLAEDGDLYGVGYGGIFRISVLGLQTALHSWGSFLGDGAAPEAPLIQAADGHLYGTTTGGGAHGLGVVYRVNAFGQVTVLHSFSDAEGFLSTAGLIQTSDGSFYGTTEVGGPGRWGSVFRLEPSGNLSVLHSFSGSDGQNPSAALLQARDGSFYGTAGGGGAYNDGTAFRLDASGSFAVIHDFREGFRPLGSLIQSKDGTFYGTTYQGGRGNRGIIFSMDSSGATTVVRNLGLPEGALPQSSLLRAADGNFYGTSPEGGAFAAGTVFRVDRAGALEVLHSFRGLQNVPSDDGAYPKAGLIQASDGAFYGTTSGGGAFGTGTVFRMDSSGAVTILHSFQSFEGAVPLAPLLQGRDGRFYGTTSAGASNGRGTIFRVDSSGNFTKLHGFLGLMDGAEPHSALIQASDGNFYGTASQGGANGIGTIFRMDPQGNVTAVHAFKTTEGVPYASLIQASDGSLYGTTTGGSNPGTIFRVDLSGNFSKLHDFDSSIDGSDPEAALIQASDGNFYGTTPRGGKDVGSGTVFRMDAAGNVTVLLNLGVNTGSARSIGGLVEDIPGVFYGVASEGGAGGAGVVFRLSLEPPQAATALSIEAPERATSGVPLSVTIRALDASGHTAEGYRGMVRLLVSDPWAHQPFQYTFTAADAGSHTFINGFTFLSPGAQSLDVTDSVLSIGARAGIAVEPARWVLALAKPGGGGRITSLPAGIDCGATCSAAFLDSVAVTLKVIPDPGFVFRGWSGHPDCADAAVTADSNKICVAQFGLAPLRPTREHSPPRRLNPRGPASP